MFKMHLTHAHIALALLTFSVQVTGDDKAQLRTTDTTNIDATDSKNLPVVYGGGPLPASANGGKDSSSRITSNSHSGVHEGGMELTPWWPLVMATGERVIVDCGVYVGKGLPGDAGEASDTEASKPDLVWIDSSGRELCEDQGSSRISCNLRLKNHPNDPKPGAYKVLSLSIGNLSQEDNGVYGCSSRWTVNNTKVVNSRTISLTVLPSDTLCNFEEESMCGWRDLADGNRTTLQWRRHDAAEKSSLNLAKGLRYDHTYGASKHHGHMLDIDSVRDRLAVGGNVARLQSPVINIKSARCLHFWYIYNGKDNEYLRVVKHKPRNANKRQPTEEDMEEGENNLFYLNNSLVGKDNLFQGEWMFASIDIPPSPLIDQKEADPYVITFEAMTCKTRCKSGSIALDDVRFFESTCEEVNYTWPDRRLKVRLLDGRRDSEGRVEILHDGMWGSVCSTQFGNKEAEVICRALGYESTTFNATGKRKSIFGQAADDVIIWLKKLGCGGHEEDLGSCIAKNETWGGTDSCSHDDDASVICGDPDFLPMVMETTTKPTQEITSHAVTSEEIRPDTTLPTVPATPESTIATTMSTPKPTSEGTPTSKASLGTTTTMTSRKPPSTTSSVTREPPAGGQVKVASAQTVITEEVITVTPFEGNTKNDSSEDTGWTEEPVRTKHQKRNTGAAVGISLTILLLTAAAGAWVYRRRTNRRKSKYIVFSNPKYSREHLPANDISLDSPLTSGSSILA